MDFSATDAETQFSVMQMGVGNFVMEQFNAAKKAIEDLMGKNQELKNEYAKLLESNVELTVDVERLNSEITELKAQIEAFKNSPVS